MPLIQTSFLHDAYLESRHSTCLVALDGIKSSRTQWGYSPKKVVKAILDIARIARWLGFFSIHYYVQLYYTMSETFPRKQRLIVNSAQPDYLNLYKVQKHLKEARYPFIEQIQEN